MYPDIDDLKFADLEGRVFCFASGAGAWSTEVLIYFDGSFSGYHRDTDMGDKGPDYPNGTFYSCSFSGRFSSLTKTGDYEYSMKCETLTQEGTPEEERIGEDGIRYITSSPYGFDDADMFSLYLPGKKTSELPEAFLSWAGMPRATDFSDVDVIDFWGLYNTASELGFSG